MNLPFESRDLIRSVAIGGGVFVTSWVGAVSSSPAIVAAAIAMGATLVILFFLACYRKFERVGKGVRNDYKQVEGLVSILACIRTELPLPPLRNWVISPDFAHILISTILQRRPTRILELGSGTSTLLAGYGLKKLGGGKVWSVDHDEHFAESSRQAVQTHGLQDYVTITHVPLGMHTFSGRPALWYDPKCLIGLPQIDMVIVDGPPSHMGEMMRYPALPVLHSLLSQEAVLILDDASREQERKVVRAWLQEFPDFQCEWIDTEKGTAILWRRPDRAVGGA